MLELLALSFLSANSEFSFRWSTGDSNPGLPCLPGMCSYVQLTGLRSAIARRRSLTTEGAAAVPAGCLRNPAGLAAWEAPMTPAGDTMRYITRGQFWKDGSL